MSQSHIYKDKRACNPNKRKKTCFAKAKNIYATRQRQLRYYLINQRNKLRIPGCPPSYFFLSPFTLESWLRTLSCKTQCFREETDHSTNGAGSFQASEVCAWILSGWQTSSVRTGIPHSCGQVCLHNYLLKKKKLLVYPSWHNTTGTAPTWELHSNHYF